MPDREPDPRRRTAGSPKQVPALSEAERIKRQSDILDEALLETFPASDPVSIGRVK